MNDSFTSLTLFHYKGFNNRWWALTQMKLAQKALSNLPGLQFFKLLGSGAGNGFEPWPNWGVYAFLGQWQNMQSAKDALGNSDIFTQFGNKSFKQKTFILKPTSGHGNWGGKMPFQEFHPEIEIGPIAVLTRARIKWNWLIPFWIKVPQVSKMMGQSNEMTHGIGIGELPLIEQATFSVWKNKDALNAYAYSAGKHREAVQKTRKVKWYSEEMFVRFNLVAEIEGLIL